MPENPIALEIHLEHLGMAASANAVAAGAAFTMFAILIACWLYCEWRNACDNWFARRYELWRKWDAEENAMELAEKMAQPRHEELEVAA